MGLGSSHAFTLVELLAAMAVLAVLMLLCSNIFSSATRAYTLGNSRVELNTAGRMVLDTMAREFAQAVVSATLVFRAETEGDTWRGCGDVYGIPGSVTYSAHFVHMPGYSLEPVWTGAEYNQAVLLHFFVRQVGDGTPTNRYQLCRAFRERGNVPNAYRTNLWLNAINNFESQNPTNIVIAEGVTAFKVMANGTNATFRSDWVLPVAARHKLPRFVDIYLGLLSDADARKAALLSGAEQRKFITRHEQRFVRRVYFRNRDAIPAPTVVP